MSPTVTRSSASATVPATRQLDVGRMTREVTMRPVLVGAIVFHIEHADGVHGVLSPLGP